MSIPMILYDRKKPYNQLPLLPPSDEMFTDVKVMSRLADARGSLGKLDGIVRTLPNPGMLINTILLREAKDSSEIENIYTSNDELYQALAVETTGMSANTREVLRYREALDSGLSSLNRNKKIDQDTILKVYRTLENTTQGYRPPTLQTVIRKGGSSLTSGEIIYTPPRGEGIIEEKMSNWIEYCNEDDKFSQDTLIKLAVTHYQFEAIHPFADGNGRTGRILNILLLRRNMLLEHPVLYLSGFIIRNKDEYYHLLAGVTQRNAWKQWIRYILEGIDQTCQFTIGLIERINELHDEMRKYITSKYPGFNQEVIKLLFYQPYIRAVNIVQSPNTGISTRQTATARLNELEKINMVSRKTVGRETVYINHQLITVLS